MFCSYIDDKPSATNPSWTKEKSNSSKPVESSHTTTSSWRIPIAGVRLPRLWENEIQSIYLKWSLRKYDGYEQRMRISNLEAMKRSVASIGEPLTADFVEPLRKDYVSEEESTADALRKDSRIYTIEDTDDSLVPRQFSR